MVQAFALVSQYYYSTLFTWKKKTFCGPPRKKGDSLSKKEKQEEEERECLGFWDPPFLLLLLLHSCKHLVPRRGGDPDLQHPLLPPTTTTHTPVLPTPPKNSLRKGGVEDTFSLLSSSLPSADVFPPLFATVLPFPNTHTHTHRPTQGPEEEEGNTQSIGPEDKGASVGEKSSSDKNNTLLFFAIWPWVGKILRVPHRLPVNYVVSLVPPLLPHSSTVTPIQPFPSPFSPPPSPGMFVPK